MHPGRGELTRLERLLWLEGEVRRHSKPVRVTPLQAGPIFFLRHQVEATRTNTAAAEDLIVRPRNAVGISATGKSMCLIRVFSQFHWEHSGDRYGGVDGGSCSGW